jgi:GTP diphosphokinase / guanosine-3',5'-bis(diphosphate) 3'-diphosphatase
VAKRTKAPTNQYNDLAWQRGKVIELINSFPPHDRAILSLALSYAEEKHEGQMRENGSKYIIYPIRVVRTLIELGKVRDLPILIAGFLHDAVEDKRGVTIKEISELFGDNAAKIVYSLSKNFFAEEKLYWEHFRGEPLTVRRVKTADRIDKLENMLEDGIGPGWPIERFRQNIVETEEYILPIAKDMPVMSEKLKLLLKSVKNLAALRT